jgi:putative hydrolase of the HAD superfamily
MTGPAAAEPSEALSAADGRVYPGLLVDWGGVLTTDVFASFAAFGAREGLGPGAVAAAFRGDPAARRLLRGLETGDLPEPEFEQGFGELLGVEPDGLIRRLLGSVSVDERMRDAVAAARRAGVATGLVSNSWGSGGYPADLLRELFDGVVISGRVGCRKPSPEIYELGARSIGLRPDQCVFVDDLAGNLTPAGDLGMATVLHVESAHTISMLAALLDVDLAAGSRCKSRATASRPHASTHVSAPEAPAAAPAAAPAPTVGPKSLGERQ